MYPARTIQDLQREFSLHKDAISKIENHNAGSFQISKGIILGVDKERENYKVYIPREGITVSNVPLFMDKAYYHLIGFPDVGDIVKVINSHNFITVFIISKGYDFQPIIMSKGSSIAMGANIP